MVTIYGADWFRKVVVGESGAGSGLGTEFSYLIWASSIVEVVGTTAGEAYWRRNDRERIAGLENVDRGIARRSRRCDILDSVEEQREKTN